MDYENVKLVGLGAIFVFLVVAAVVIAVTDARRSRAEREARIQEQIEVLKRIQRQAKARAALRQRIQERLDDAALQTGSYSPSIYVVSELPRIAAALQPRPRSDQGGDGGGLFAA